MTEDQRDEKEGHEQRVVARRSPVAFPRRHPHVVLSYRELRLVGATIYLVVTVIHELHQPVATGKAMFGRLADNELGEVTTTRGAW